MRLSETDLMAWGEEIGRGVRPPVFIALHGPLGAGKSVLARAVARGAGVEGPVPSPTFNLMFRYEGVSGTRVVHMDLYRLESPREVDELGWDELGASDDVVLVEWPERAGDRLPADRWDVRLAIPRGEPDRREVSCERVGEPPHLPGFPMNVESQGR